LCAFVVSIARPFLLKSSVPKWCKTIIAILLMPVCWGAALALWKVLRTSGSAETTWVAALSGAGCWLAIYLLLPKPMWVYVFGHELTHVLWTWLFGGRVKRFRTSSRGGQVVVTRSNFVIALAPYFFPLYAMLVMFAFAMAGWFLDLQPLRVWFHLLLGAAYAFHITLTWHILKNQQSDITEQGYLFSAVVIFLGNAIVLLMGIPLVTGEVGVPAAFRWWMDYTDDALGIILRLVSSRSA
jgi:hypothetical protein